MTTPIYEIPTIDPQSKINIANDVNAALEKIDEILDSEATTTNAALEGKAPTNHASEDAIYGVASETQYGHVKISNEVSENDATSAITPKGVHTAISANLNDMVIIGDSYSSTNYMPEDDCWWKYVADAMHLIPHCFAVSGTGFQVGATTFSQQIDNAAANEEFDNDNVGYVLIFGILNDCKNGNDSTIINDITNTINNAKSKFPNAKIYVIGANTWQQMTVKQGNAFSSAYASTYLRSGAFATGAYYINVTYLFVGSDNLTNSNHPNSEMHRKMGFYILNKMNGINQHRETSPQNILQVVNSATCFSKPSDASDIDMNFNVYVSDDIIFIQIYISGTLETGMYKFYIPENLQFRTIGNSALQPGNNNNFTGYVNLDANSASGSESGVIVNVAPDEAFSGNLYATFVGICW